MPLVALFVRDAVGLDVPTNAMVPPHLDGDLPDRSTRVDMERRVAAGAAWITWWQALVEQVVLMHQGRGDVDQRAWMRQRAAEHQAVFDPPEFDSLAEQPALCETTRATFEEALQWADARRRALLFPPAGRHGQFDHNTIRSVAEQVALRHQVSPGAVRACAVVLPVQGNWWHRFAPGAVLCSVHAARDPAVARTVLTDTFESGLLS